MTNQQAPSATVDEPKHLSSEQRQKLFNFLLDSFEIHLLEDEFNTIESIVFPITYPYTLKDSQQPTVDEIVKIEEPKGLHSCPDAKVWADYYCAINPSADNGTMIGWFANAMMAMHDHLYQTNKLHSQQPTVEVEKIPDSLAYILKDVYTFDEFVEFGKRNADTLVKGMPWHFDFMGHPVTHENDECYLIPLPNAETLRFTPNDILILENDNNVKIQPIPELSEKAILIAKYQALWFTKEIHSIKELLNRFLSEALRGSYTREDMKDFLRLYHDCEYDYDEALRQYDTERGSDGKV